MKVINSKSSLLILLAVLFGLNLSARNDRLRFEIKDALETPDAKAKVVDEVKLYWGKETKVKFKEKVASVKTNKKTNAFNKSDLQACQWVFLSAVIALQDRARELGGDAVINIRSNYQNIPYDSTEKFECGAGNIIAGVALMGVVVKTK